MLDGLTYLKPEIFLSISAMLLLMYGVFNQKKPFIAQRLFAVAAIILISTIYLLHEAGGAASEASRLDNGVDWYLVTALGKSFVYDPLAFFSKFLICITSAAVCIIGMNSRFYAGSNQNVFEFPVILLLAVVGMFILVSSNDLLTFYLGLELQSLALYVLVAVNRDCEKSTESGVKYFVLGALASGVILFGTSFIYGFAGSTNFSELATIIKSNNSIEALSPGMVFGFVLILAGLFFKLSAVPMHMWAPDVYEGAPKSVVAFIATAPKIAAIVFLMRLVSVMEGPMFLPFGKILILVSAASMIVGAFAALRQNSFKRLLAYSSIANVGYMLIAVAVGTEPAFQSAIVYLTIYMVGTIGTFAILSLIQKADEDVDAISEIAGLAKTNPLYALALATFMFSVAGIPPMAGFFGKFFVFKEAISAGYITLSIIGVVTSVVACYYYLRIIKLMYFDESNNSSIIISDNSLMLRFVILVSLMFTLLMIFFSDTILSAADIATSSLF